MGVGHGNLTKSYALSESEEKVTLESESYIFLTLSLGTSGAQNKNLRPHFKYTHN